MPQSPQARVTCRIKDMDVTYRYAFGRVVDTTRQGSDIWLLYGWVNARIFQRKEAL